MVVCDMKPEDVEKLIDRQSEFEVNLDDGR
jgi:hypothetical protein